MKNEENFKNIFGDKFLKIRLIVIGGSAGSIPSLKSILQFISKDFPIPIVICTHLSPNRPSTFYLTLKNFTSLEIKEADQNEKILPGRAYVTPSGYHLLVEANQTLSFSTDLPENYSIPSIDVLFESASEIYGDKLLGILLSGANNDGSKGLRKIADEGGTIIIQDPTDSESSIMPLSGIKLCDTKNIYSAKLIGKILESLGKKNLQE